MKHACRSSALTSFRQLLAQSEENKVSRMQFHLKCRDMAHLLFPFLLPWKARRSLGGGERSWPRALQELYCLQLRLRPEKTAQTMLSKLWPMGILLKLVNPGRLKRLPEV